MSDRQAAERACKDGNPIIDGRKANVNLAYIGAKPRGNNQQGKLLEMNRCYIMNENNRNLDSVLHCSGH